MKSWNQDLLGKGTYGKELVQRSWDKENLQSLEQRLAKARVIGDETENMGRVRSDQWFFSLS